MSAENVNFFEEVITTDKNWSYVTKRERRRGREGERESERERNRERQRERVNRWREEKRGN